MMYLPIKLSSVYILSPSLTPNKFVAVDPGAIAFTIIPYGNSFSASPEVNPFIPHLDNLYGDQAGSF